MALKNDSLLAVYQDNDTFALKVEDLKSFIETGIDISGYLPLTGGNVDKLTIGDPDARADDLPIAKFTNDDPDFGDGT